MQEKESEKYHSDITPSGDYFGEFSSTSSPMQEDMPYKNGTTTEEKDIGVIAQEKYAEMMNTRNPLLLPKVENLLREAIDKSEVNKMDNKFDLAICTMYQGRDDESKKIFREIIAENPQNYQAMTFLASKLNKKDPEKMQLINTSAEIIERIYNGIMSQKDNPEERYAGVIKKLEDIQAINYLEIGEDFMRSNQYGPAEDYIIQALQLVDEKNEVNLTLIMSDLGDIYAHNGNTDDARLTYESAIMYKEVTPRIYLGLADLDLKEYNHVEALKRCIKAFDQNNRYICENNNGLIIEKVLEIFDKRGKGGGTLKGTLSDVRRAIEETGISTETSKVMLAFFQYARGSLNDKSVNEDAADLLLSDPYLKTDGGSFANMRRDTTQVIRPTHMMLVNTFGDLEYIIKMNNPDNTNEEIKQKMRDEYVTQSFLSTALSLYKEEKGLEKEILEIDDPLFFLENEKNFISVQKKIRSITLKDLEEFADKEELGYEIRKAIDTATLISVVATRLLKNEDDRTYIDMSDGQGNLHHTEIKRFDYTENLERRFLDRLNLTKAQRDRYAEQHFYFVDRFTNNQLRYFLHGDLNACNTMLEGRLIDFEMKATGNPVYDFMHLITNIDFSDLDKKALTDYFRKRMIDLEVPAAHIIKMMSTTDQNMIHTQICKIGSNINQKEYLRAKAYLEKTLEDLEELKQNGLRKILEKTMKGQLPI